MLRNISSNLQVSTQQQERVVTSVLDMMKFSSSIVALMLLSGCGESESPPSTPIDNIPTVDIQKAKYLYNYNCSTCHAKDATGQVGPNIAYSSLSRINMAIATVDLMSYLNTLSLEERELISVYLNTLPEP